MDAPTDTPEWLRAAYSRARQRVDRLRQAGAPADVVRDAELDAALAEGRMKEAEERR